MVENCLGYALRFWSVHREYKIWYNSDHCINSRVNIIGGDFLSAESFGYEYFSSAFGDLLSSEEKLLLVEYFSLK